MRKLFIENSFKNYYFSTKYIVNTLLCIRFAIITVTFILQLLLNTKILIISRMILYSPATRDGRNRRGQVSARRLSR